MNKGEKRILSVSEVNASIKGILEGIPFFASLVVKGEISNWKRYKSGVFFDLKDEKGARLSCTIWNDYLEYLPFSPKDGDEVLAYGKLSVYALKGRYSLSAFRLEKQGLGSSLLALEELKKKLSKEGLFDESRKRELPKFPKAIGIICGKDSAAESDLLKNISRRYPLADIYVFNAIVQGSLAPKSLLNAIEKASKAPLDVLILARGGGSNEDLSSFNDERVVRAFSSFPKPTISAVGHEIDVTLVDFVSDKRASTPTGAAELATPDLEELKETLLEDEKRLQGSLQKLISIKEAKLRSLSSRPFFLDPTSAYRLFEEKLENYRKRLHNQMESKLSFLALRLKKNQEKLELSSPKKTIGRGYSMLLDEKGEVLSSAQELSEGTRFKAILQDGIVKAISEGKEQDE